MANDVIHRSSDRLRDRRPAGSTGSVPTHGVLPELPRGLRGVVVSETSLSDVRGDEGFYHYRGYPAIDLATSRPFEDVWRLVVDGSLPADRSERDRFLAEVAPLRQLPDAVRAVLPAVASHGDPMESFRTALSLLASVLGFRPVLDLTQPQRRRDALAASASAPTLFAALHRLRLGLEPVEPRDDLRHAANLLWMLSGDEPDPRHAEAIERYLIATIDHGFNASAFAARVVASTGADVGACLVAAAGALSGPLHGGAPSRVLELLEDIGDPERTERVVRARLDAGERIMGFGHAVYRNGTDPRSAMLRDVALGLGGPRVGQAVEVERRVLDVLAEVKPGHRLRTNVEFYASVVLSTCGLPREMFTPTFASSRIVGWCAHVLEQAADARIIRPSARYVGPPAPREVPPPI